MPSNRSSSGYSSSSRNTCGPGFASEERHRRPRGDVDEPAERQDDADHNAGEDARPRARQDRGDGDPEVEPRHPVQAAQLGDVDHPEHDRVDDDRREHGLRQVARTRGASTISVAMTSAAGDERGHGVRAPDDSFSELAERLVDTGIPWNTPAPTFAIPCATDSWLTSMR